MGIEDFLAAALEKGIFAGLFVFAFWYIISEHKQRETNQRELYNTLSEDVEKIKQSISFIEEASKRSDENHSATTKEIIHLKHMVESLEKTVSKEFKKDE